MGNTVAYRLLAAFAACLALAACERAMRDMYQQPRPHPDAADSAFADDRSARAPPPGSVPRAAPATPPLAGMAQLRRGRERYDIYCAPCHSPTGDGDGMVVRRGFPRPPSFHDAAERALPDARIDAAIRDGRGAMPAFGARVDAADRIAIVAYLRALQLSRDARLEDLPPGARAALESAP